MNKTHFLFLAALAALCSCNKETQEYNSARGEEIVIGMGDSFDATVETKTTAITAVPTTLYWGATKGGNAAGTTNETLVWSKASASLSSGKISTGKYQTNTPTAYNYYVTNKDNLTVGTSTTTITTDNTVDALAGRTFGNSTTSPSVELQHIFSRTGTLTMNTQSGYTISAVSWTIAGSSTVNGTAGTYDLKSGTWTAASTKITEDTAIASDSDMYLIPGTYTIKCTYTLTKGDWTRTFTKSASVNLTMGKINNITGTASGGDASEIKITVTLADWQTVTLTPTFA